MSLCLINVHNNRLGIRTRGTEFSWRKKNVMINGPHSSDMFVWKANKKSSITLNTYGMCKCVTLVEDALRTNKKYYICDQLSGKVLD